jgi:hypothetical protein
MQSGVNAFEISDIQEEKTEAVVGGDQSVTVLHFVENQPNGVFPDHSWK